MTTLSQNVGRDYELNIDPMYDDVPVIAADIVFEGAAVGESSSAGTGRPLVGGDTFLGFAAAKVDNTDGSAGDKNIRVRRRGCVKLSVTDADAIDHKGETVYATDDDTFTLVSSGGTAIGKLQRYISGTTWMVMFEAAGVRSI